MKIVDRKTFLDLPSGTLFSPGEPAQFDDLYVKGDTISYMDEVRAGDFYELALCDFEYGIEGLNNPNEDYIEAFLKMLESKETRPLRASLNRNGTFERNTVYLIYERDDLLKLREHIEKALSVIGKGTINV